MKYVVIGFLIVLFLSCGDSGEITSEEEVENIESKDTVTQNEEPREYGEEEPLFIAEKINIDPDAMPRNATMIRFLPNNPEQFIVIGQYGELAHFGLRGESAVFLGRTKLVDTEKYTDPMDNGLTAFAFSLNYEIDKKIYVSYTTADNMFSRISSLVWDMSNYDDIKKTEQVILDIDRKNPEWYLHGIYSVEFDKDGYLYVAVGDGGHSVTENMDSLPVTDPHSLLGKILRIKPGVGGSYEPHPDNRYVGSLDGKNEIWGEGVRSPFRLLVHEEQVIFIDVGGSLNEELNIVSANESHNFGWPACEGVHGECEGVTLPSLAVMHSWSLSPDKQPSHPVEVNAYTYLDEDEFYDGKKGESMFVGTVYHENLGNPYNSSLTGKLFFGEYFKGFIRYTNFSDTGELFNDEHFMHLQWVTSMTIGYGGYLYASVYPRWTSESYIYKIFMNPNKK